MLKGKYVQLKSTMNWGIIEAHKDELVRVLWVDTLSTTVENIKDLLIK